MPDPGGPGSVSSRVELIYTPDCPNLGLARKRLIRALHSVGLRAEWQEWDQAQGDNPDYTRDYASPTILVNGEDVSTDSAVVDADSCRLYRGKDGRLTGAPPVVAIAAALQMAQGRETEETK